MKKLLLAAACLPFLAGCGIKLEEKVAVDLPTDTAPVTTTSEFSLAGGMSEIQPAATDTLSGTVDLARFGETAFNRVYELETPLNTEFSFTLVGRGLANFGMTQLSLGHVADNGVAPDKGAESLVAAGMVIDGTGLSYGGNFLTAIGDGFVRMTVTGRIQAGQVLVCKVPLQGGQDELCVGIRVAIGNSSVINLPNLASPGDHPTATKTNIFSSDSWQFGLPAIAVSGDRYSVVCYDGVMADPNDYYGERTRRWLQHDASTGVTTGGSAAAASYDFGSWRDQEIAALGNVLAVVYSASGSIRTEISLNRGATFPISQVLDDQEGWGMQRLVQVAISPNYNVACLYWSCEFVNYIPKSRLVLVEAAPTAFDSNNTPTGYSWGAPVTINAPAGDVTPLLMHLEYSGGGDVVIGYGYTVSVIVGLDMISTASFRCAVRLNGQASFSDGQLDSEESVRPVDPHVSLLGSGATMQIFYSYEKTDGIHMKYSSNAGQNWQSGAVVAAPGAMQPSALARVVGGQKRVDLLYLVPVGYGMELHNLRWDDFTPGAPGVPHRLTEASAQPGGTPPAGCPQGLLIRTVGNFGYDAVLNGDKVAIAVHELVTDSYSWWMPIPGMPIWRGGVAVPMVGNTATGAPTPPPAVLMPGMTGAVPPADPAHRNTLSIIEFD